MRIVGVEESGGDVRLVLLVSSWMDRDSLFILHVSLFSTSSMDLLLPAAAAAVVVLRDGVVVVVRMMGVIGVDGEEGGRRAALRGARRFQNTARRRGRVVMAMVVMMGVVVGREALLVRQEQQPLPSAGNSTRASHADPARWSSPATNSRTTRTRRFSDGSSTPRCRRGWRHPPHPRLPPEPARSYPPPPRWRLPLYPHRPRPPIASLVATSSLRTSSVCNTSVTRDR